MNYHSNDGVFLQVLNCSWIERQFQTLCISFPSRDVRHSSSYLATSLEMSGNRNRSTLLAMWIQHNFGWWSSGCTTLRPSCRCPWVSLQCGCRLRHCYPNLPGTTMKDPCPWDWGSWLVNRGSTVWFMFVRPQSTCGGVQKAADNTASIHCHRHCYGNRNLLLQLIIIIIIIKIIIIIIIIIVIIIIITIIFIMPVEIFVTKSEASGPLQNGFWLPFCATFWPWVLPSCKWTPPWYRNFALEVRVCYPPVPTILSESGGLIKPLQIGWIQSVNG